MSKLFGLAIFICFGIAANAAAIPFPSDIIPFTSIASYTKGLEGDVLVLGYTNPNLESALAAVPFPSSTGEKFSNASIELAPGVFVSNLFVPTEAQRKGDFSTFDAAIIDPTTMAARDGQLVGLPFVANYIPTSRLFGDNGLFAFEMSQQQPLNATPEPSELTISCEAILLLVSLNIARRLLHKGFL
jgi:hypothetical protein